MFIGTVSKQKNNAGLTKAKLVAAHLVVKLPLILCLKGLIIFLPFPTTFLVFMMYIE